MKRKVLLVSTLYRPNIGGIENSLYHLALEYESLGYQIDIVSSDRNNQSLEILKSFEKVNNNISLYRYKSEHEKFLGIFKSYFNQYKMLKNLLVLSESYNVILARSALSVIACRHAGFKRVIYLLPGVSLYQSNEKNLYSKTTLLKKIKVFISNKYNHCLQFVAVRLAHRNLVFSDNMSIQVKNALSVNVDSPIVKPGVDPERFYPVDDSMKQRLKQKLNLPKDKKIILGLGRFVKAKGFDIIINSLKYLPKDYIVCLVGHGVESETYRDLALSLEVSENLFIFPPTSKPEDFYKASDFFAMTSSYEPLGQTIIEAQACGLPIIALNPDTLDVITAINEVTTEYTREICDHQDGKELSNSIIKMNHRVEAGRVTKYDTSEYAFKTFSWNKLAISLIDL